MASENAHFDGNHRPTMTAALNTDGATIMNLTASPTTHALLAVLNGGGTDHGPAASLHDGNHIGIGMVVSSSDLKTPVALYINSSRQLLIKT